MTFTLKNHRWWIAAGSALLLVGFFTVSYFLKAAPTCPADSNVCRGTMTVGGQTVTYYYTRYLAPGQHFKVRFNAGNVNTGNAILFAATKFPVTPTGLTQARTCGNPPPFLSTAGNRIALPCTEITSSNIVATSEGQTQGVLDFVMDIPLPNINAGDYTPELFLQFGSAPVIEKISLTVDATAPANTTEVMSFSIGGTVEGNTCSDYPASDPLWGDNDLDFAADCRDDQCDVLTGEPGGLALCEYAQELNCLDRFDNDFDKDGVDDRDTFDDAFFDYNRDTGLDCRDLDCDAQLGDSGTGPNGETLFCRYNNSNVKGQGEAKGYPESCRDGFNNDSDNGEGSFVVAASYFDVSYSDCSDRNCWRMGNSSDALGQPCPAKENFDPAWCGDSVDNDFDDGINGLDKNNSTGRDCAEYDCAFQAYAGGQYTDTNGEAGPAGTTYACPFNEARGSDGTIDAARCFDGVDNDLDACEWNAGLGKYVKPGTATDCVPGAGYTIDCGDLDCLGIENPNNPGQICFPNEFEIGKYQMCGDGLDNDGDDPNPSPPNQTAPSGAVGGLDCEDNRFEDGGAGDCWQKFGNCGPCPDVETLNFSACADNRDNDLDGASNCGDSDCAGEIGRLAGAAMCVVSGGEAGFLCFDGFDNDADGNVDCRDANCDGASRLNPLGVVEACGSENAAGVCFDGFDNDGDGALDCLDASCSGIGACAANWPVSSCVTVPEWSAWTAITPSIRAREYSKARVSSEHLMEIEGSASQYSTLNIVIGSNVSGAVADQYPYDLTTCVFELPSGSNIEFRPDSPQAGSIVPSTANPVGSFTARLRCPTPALPSASESFRIQIAANGSAGLEIAGTNFSTALYESTPPQVGEIETGGADANGQIFVPYGGAFSLRGAPNDPGTGLGASGICGCTLNTDFFTPGGNEPAGGGTSGGNCAFSISNIKRNDFYSVAVSAEDGADNASAPCFGLSCDGATPLMVTVTPIVETQIILDRKTGSGAVYPAEISGANFIAPFYKGADRLVMDGVQFRTADNGSFSGSDCVARVTDDGGFVFETTANAQIAGSAASCDGEWPIGSFGLPGDGRYFISARMTDTNGYAIEAPKHVFYVCSLDPALYPLGHACKKADFDQDGAVEGVAAKFDLYGDVSLVCDNCPAKKNADQADANANGIGDACEPGGFCSVDQVPCLTDAECIVNTCDTGTGYCTVIPFSGNPAACSSDSDCAVNYCSNTIIICADEGVPGAPQYCLVDGQCPVGGNCGGEGGACENDPAKVCYDASDCGAPICENVDGETGVGTCSNNASFSCTAGGDLAVECHTQCFHICEKAGGGVCIDGQPDCECVSEDPWGVCSIDEAPCASDTQCAANVCDEDNRCALDGLPCANVGSVVDCIQQRCVKDVGRCAEDGGGGTLCVTDNDCADGYGCKKDIGLCGDENKACILDGQCADGSACEDDFGVCSESGTVCVENTHCPQNETCQNIGFPFLETQYGSVYSSGRVEALSPPPPGRFNATYCIRAQEVSETIKTQIGACEPFGEPFNFPSIVSQFASVAGRIDIAGIEAGQFGPVEAIVSEDNINAFLGGKVYTYSEAEQGSAFHMTGKNFTNGAGTSGAGAVLVYGDLYIDGNIAYETGAQIQNLSELASIGWIVLDDPLTPEKEGNVFIASGVTKLAGAFFAEGTVKTGKSLLPLTVNGLMIAKTFQFERQFASTERGSEQIIYDGRAQANPPPGMKDLTRALPILRP